MNNASIHQRPRLSGKRTVVAAGLALALCLVPGLASAQVTSGSDTGPGVTPNVAGAETTPPSGAQTAPVTVRGAQSTTTTAPLVLPRTGGAAPDTSTGLLIGAAGVSLAIAGFGLRRTARNSER